MPVSNFHPSHLLLGAFGADSSLVIAREACQREVRWDEVDLSDWDFAFRYYDWGVVGVEYDGYLYRQHPQQLTRSAIGTPTWLVERWRHRASVEGLRCPSPSTVGALAFPSGSESISRSTFLEAMRVLTELQQHFLGQCDGQFERVIRDVITRRRLATWALQSSLSRLAPTGELLASRTVTIYSARVLLDLALAHRSRRWRT
jgi:hypothetical protein